MVTDPQVGTILEDAPLCVDELSVDRSEFSSNFLLLCVYLVFISSPWVGRQGWCTGSVFLV